jgi:hypothetical protein
LPKQITKTIAGWYINSGFFGIMAIAGGKKTPAPKRGANGLRSLTIGKQIS